MWYYIITERKTPIQTDRKDKIMINFAGEKYKVLYKNGKKVEVLERIW